MQSLNRNVFEIQTDREVSSASSARNSLSWSSALVTWSWQAECLGNRVTNQWPDMFKTRCLTMIRMKNTMLGEGAYYQLLVKICGQLSVWKEGTFSEFCIPHSEHHCQTSLIMSVKNLFLRNNRIRNQTAKGRGKKGCFLTQSYLDESVSEVTRLLLERVHPLTQQSVLRSQALKCGGDMKPDPFVLHSWICRYPML